MEEMTKREMVYGNESLNEFLYVDTYKDVRYIIKSYGTHPCCYLALPQSSPFFEKDHDYIPLDCHGGLTYSNASLFGFIEDGPKWFVGWDYAHAGDRVGNRVFGYDFGKAWTTDELIQECKDAIDNLIEITSEELDS